MIVMYDNVFVRPATLVDLTRLYVARHGDSFSIRLDSSSFDVQHDATGAHVALNRYLAADDVRALAKALLDAVDAPKSEQVTTGTITITNVVANNPDFRFQDVYDGGGTLITNKPTG